MNNRKRIQIVIAEDDDDDYLLTSEALVEANVLNPIDRVVNGVELIDYLRREGKHEYLRGKPLPSIILLDLNMPKMDGREALEIIRKEPLFKKIPVIILTTSRAQEDILKSYNAGCNSYIRKPINFEDLIKVMIQFKRFWIEIVEIPDVD